MSPPIKLCLTFVLIMIVAMSTATAQKGLQDNFYLEKTWTNNYALSASDVGYGLAVDKSNQVFVADGNRVIIYDLNGTNLQTWAIAGARFLALHPSSNLVFVAAVTTTNQIKVLDSNGSLIRQWGSSGTGAGQFQPNPYNAVAVSASGLVYVADELNHRVQVFDSSGTYLSQWGAYGSAVNQFIFPLDIEVGIDGNVTLADYGNYRFQQFKPDGTFLRQYTLVAGQSAKTVSAGPDGVLCVATVLGDLRLLSPSLDYIAPFNFGAYGPNSRIHGAAFSPDGQRLVILADKEVRVFRRFYRTMGPKPPNAIPLPTVLSTAQRGGTLWIDVDFLVVDSDSPTVQVGAIAFADGRQDLLAAVPMKSFTNGTDIVSLTNVTAGVQHHLTWNAGADWLVSYGDLKINILAKDNRDLLLTHLIVIPSNTTYSTPMTISRSAFGHTDFQGVWTWLIASGHPNVTLSTGSVYAVGNNYGVTNNALLAQTQIASSQTNTLTTVDGRMFLFSLISSNFVSTVYSNMIAREATSNEIFRAALGTKSTNSTSITRWQPMVQLSGLPQNVNEYGFDTGPIGSTGQLPTNAWWVVLAPKGP